MNSPDLIDFNDASSPEEEWKSFDPIIKSKSPKLVLPKIINQISVDKMIRNSTNTTTSTEMETPENKPEFLYAQKNKLKQKNPSMTYKLNVYFDEVNISFTAGGLNTMDHIFEQIMSLINVDFYSNRIYILRILNKLDILHIKEVNVSNYIPEQLINFEWVQDCLRNGYDIDLSLDILNSVDNHDSEKTDNFDNLVKILHYPVFCITNKNNPFIWPQSIRDSLYKNISYIQQNTVSVTLKYLEILLETFYKSGCKVLDEISTTSGGMILHKTVKAYIQIVKALIIMYLHNIETNDLTQNIKRLISITNPHHVGDKNEITRLISKINASILELLNLCFNQNLLSYESPNDDVGLNSKGNWLCHLLKNDHFTNMLKSYSKINDLKEISNSLAIKVESLHNLDRLHIGNNTSTLIVSLCHGLTIIDSQILPLHKCGRFETYATSSCLDPSFVVMIENNANTNNYHNVQPPNSSVNPTAHYKFVIDETIEFNNIRHMPLETYLAFYIFPNSNYLSLQMNEATTNTGSFYFDSTFNTSNQETSSTLSNNVTSVSPMILHLLSQLGDHLSPTFFQNAVPNLSKSTSLTVSSNKGQNINPIPFYYAFAPIIQNDNSLSTFANANNKIRLSFFGSNFKNSNSNMTQVNTINSTEEWIDFYPKHESFIDLLALNKQNEKRTPKSSQLPNPLIVFSINVPKTMLLDNCLSNTGLPNISLVNSNPTNQDKPLLRFTPDDTRNEFDDDTQVDTCNNELSFRPKLDISNDNGDGSIDPPKTIAFIPYNRFCHPNPNITQIIAQVFTFQPVNRTDWIVIWENRDSILKYLSTIISLPLIMYAFTHMLVVSDCCENDIYTTLQDVINRFVNNEYTNTLIENQNFVWDEQSSLGHKWDVLSSIYMLQPEIVDPRIRTLAINLLNCFETSSLIFYIPQLITIMLKFNTFLGLNNLDDFIGSDLLNMIRIKAKADIRFALTLLWNLNFYLPMSFNPPTTLAENNRLISISDGYNKYLDNQHHHPSNDMMRSGVIIDMVRSLYFAGAEIRSKQPSLDFDYVYWYTRRFFYSLSQIYHHLKRLKGDDKYREQFLKSKLIQLKSDFCIPSKANNKDNNNNNTNVIPLTFVLDPGFRISNLDVKRSTYFKSKTMPLKLCFIGGNINKKNDMPKDELPYKYLIYKHGDDLRQDQYCLQMIKLMDKLWLNDGLDLNMVTFTCLPFTNQEGLVEFVHDCETLRNIQMMQGLSGTFRSQGIYEWLQKYNTQELDFKKAINYFTRSCAGYCVATYILGICDRHNDNILISRTGHIFHIDFGKILGDSQMFGNVKRDRVPFVFTSDMAYVINQGQPNSAPSFQRFIDLCCQAYNILRIHAHKLLLITRMTEYLEIPGIPFNSIEYLRKTLVLHMNDAQASAHFTKLIKESLSSKFTQFNFFIHGLFQTTSQTNTDMDSVSCHTSDYNSAPDTNNHYQRTTKSHNYHNHSNINSILFPINDLPQGKTLSTSITQKNEMCAFNNIHLGQDALTFNPSFAHESNLEGTNIVDNGGSNSTIISKDLQPNEFDITSVLPSQYKRGAGKRNSAIFSFTHNYVDIEDTKDPISHVEIIGVEKIYDTVKRYVYHCRVHYEKSKIPISIYRTYAEFAELRNKIYKIFPLSNFPVFSSMSSGKNVTQTGLTLVSKFMKMLFETAPEVKQCGLVITFFYPILRDQKERSTSKALSMPTPININMNLNLNLNSAQADSSTRLSTVIPLSIPAQNNGALDIITNDLDPTLYDFPQIKLSICYTNKSNYHHTKGNPLEKFDTPFTGSNQINHENDIAVTEHHLPIEPHLQILVCHCKNLKPKNVTSNNESPLRSNPPDTYVKLILEPDKEKLTKRRTKVVPRTFHPSFNEMFTFPLSFETIKSKTLKITVMQFERFKENELLAKLYLPLSNIKLNQNIISWFPLSS